MSSNEADTRALISFINRKVDKKIKEAQINTGQYPMYLALLDGFVEPDASYPGSSSKSLLQNGGMESSKYFTAVPEGWMFSGCRGVVMPYSAQPSESSILYVSSSGESGVPSSSGVPVFQSDVGSMSVIQAVLSGSDYYSVQVDESFVSSATNTDKYLLLQPVSSGGVYCSEFSSYQSVPMGVLVPGFVYESNISMKHFNGRLPEIFLTSSGSVTSAAGYTDDAGTSFVYVEPSASRAGSAGASVYITFYDSSASEIDTLVSKEIPLVEGMGLVTKRLLFRVPESCVNAVVGVVVNELFGTDNDSRHAVMIDNFEVYPVGPSKLVVMGGQEIEGYLSDKETELEALSGSIGRVAPPVPTGLTLTAGFTSGSVGESMRGYIAAQWIEPDGDFERYSVEFDDLTMGEQSIYRDSVAVPRGWASGTASVSPTPVVSGDYDLDVVVGSYVTTVSCTIPNLVLQGLASRTFSVSVRCMNAFGDFGAPVSGSVTLDSANLPPIQIPTNAVLSPLVAGIMEASWDFAPRNDLMGFDVTTIRSTNEYTTTGTPSWGVSGMPVLHVVSPSDSAVFQFQVEPDYLNYWYKVRVVTDVYGGYHSSGYVETNAISPAASGSIDPNMFTTGTLRAETVITVGRTSSTQQVVITSGGIYGYDGAATPSFTLDKNSGLTLAGGNIVLKDGGSVLLMGATSGATSGCLRLDNNGVRAIDSTGVTTVHLTSGGLYGYVAGQTAFSLTTAGLSLKNANISLSGSGYIDLIGNGGNSSVRLNNSGMTIKSSSGATIGSISPSGVSFVDATITGGLVRTATSGLRAELDENNLSLYDDDGYKQGGIFAYGGAFYMGGLDLSISSGTITTAINSAYIKTTPAHTGVGLSGGVDLKIYDGGTTSIFTMSYNITGGSYTPVATLDIEGDLHPTGKLRLDSYLNFGTSTMCKWNGSQLDMCRNTSDTGWAGELKTNRMQIVDYLQLWDGTNQLRLRIYGGTFQKSYNGGTWTEV